MDAGVRRPPEDGGFELDYLGDPRFSAAYSADSA